MDYHMHDILGTIGVVMLLVTYFLLQNGALRSTDWRYSAANGVGALLVLASLSADFNLPAFLVEFCWLGISVYGLIRDLSRRSQPV